jgi:hypothetical protein
MHKLERLPSWSLMRCLHPAALVGAVAAAVAAVVLQQRVKNLAPLRRRPVHLLLPVEASEDSSRSFG